MKKLGRPPIPAHKRRSKRLFVMLRADEHQLLHQAARAGGQSLSAWVRSRLLKAARRAVKHHQP